MMRFYIFLIFLLQLSCSKEDSVEDLIDNCEALVDKEILTEEERGTECIHFEVYRYKDELYQLCVCCICDKAPIAVDCFGNSLCEDYSCMNDFFQKAEYLFSVR